MKTLALLLISYLIIGNSNCTYEVNPVYFIGETEQIKPESYELLEKISNFCNTTDKKIEDIKITYKESVCNKSKDKFLASKRTYLIYEYLKNKIKSKILIKISYLDLEIEESYAEVTPVIGR